MGFRRTKVVVLATVLLSAGMLLASDLPVQAQQKNIIFVPPQTFAPDATVPPPGATAACTGGPPFVFDVSGVSGNCIQTRVGPPPDLICDDPTKITVINTTPPPPVAIGTVNGFLCHEPTEEAAPVICPPASQELGNEGESGNVDLTGGVSSSGDSANQTAAPLDFGNAGSDQNAQGVLQTCGSTADDAELAGGSMEISPVLNGSSDQGVGESSASQQG